MNSNIGENLNDRKLDKDQNRFVNSLTEAFIVNDGDPENLERLVNFKILQKHPANFVLDFIQQASHEAQDSVELKIQDPAIQDIVSLTNYVDECSEDTRNHEILPALKVLAESPKIPPSYETNGVNFKHLYEFLYCTMYGLPANIPMNDLTKRCLADTYKELMDKVEHDTIDPHNIERIKKVIGLGNINGIPSGINEIHKIFEDPSLNVFNLPFNEMLKIDASNLQKSDEISLIEDLLEKYDKDNIDKNVSETLN